MHGADIDCLMERIATLEAFILRTIDLSDRIEGLGRDERPSLRDGAHQLATKLRDDAERVLLEEIETVAPRDRLRLVKA
jgi:hypothetical protein